MRKFLLMPVMLLISMSAMGCGLTAEQRQEMIGDIKERVTAVLAEKTQEIAGDLVSDAVESLTKKATDLGLSAEKAKEFAEEAAGRAKEALVKLVKDEVPAAVEAIAEKVIPEATEDGTGKGVAGFLYMALNGLIGLGKKGILGGAA